MQPSTIEKIFKATGVMEGGRGYANLSGNFDGQGISWGFLQWNLGRGTLQPLLLAMATSSPATFARCFTQRVADAPYNGNPVDLSAVILKACRTMTPAQAVAWAAARQVENKLAPHWAAAFNAAADVPGFQAIQRQHASNPYLIRAEHYMDVFGLKSERAAALLFDLTVQCGSLLEPGEDAVMAVVHAQAKNPDRNAAELAVMEAIAHAAARQVDPKWAGDVLARKLTIATGAGTVHSDPVNMKADFGITMDPA